MPWNNHQFPPYFQEVLARHGNKVTALNHLDSELVGEAGEVMEDFRFHELLERPVLQPLLVIIVMMALLQFSGQGAVTAYTAQIFKVNMKCNCMVSKMVIPTKTLVKI